MSLAKKLDAAKDAGYVHGFNQACQLWEHVIKHTSGIGPVLQSKLMDSMRQLAAEIHNKRR